MWMIGYVLMWALALGAISLGFLLIFVGSQFDKILGWFGSVLMGLGGFGAWKLYHLVNITVVVS